MNEVENLYFSHSRKPRTELPVEPDNLDANTRDASHPLVATNQSPSNSLSIPDIPQQTSPVVDAEQVGTQEDSEEALKSLPPLSKSTSHDTTSLTSPGQSTSLKPKSSLLQMPSSHPPTPSSNANSPFQQTSSFLYAATVSSPSPSHSLPRRPSLQPSNSLLNLNNNNSSNASSSLTYDSFWSSHSSSTLQYRNLLANTSATTAAPSQSKCPAPGTSIAASGMLTSTMTLAPSFQPQPPAFHSAMGAFDHSDLAFAQHDGSVPYNNATQSSTPMIAQTTYYRR